jgi:hypothetical protein
MSSLSVRGDSRRRSNQAKAAASGQVSSGMPTASWSDKGVQLALASPAGLGLATKKHEARYRTRCNDPGTATTSKGSEISVSTTEGSRLERPDRSPPPACPGLGPGHSRLLRHRRRGHRRRWRVRRCWRLRRCRWVRWLQWRWRVRRVRRRWRVRWLQRCRWVRRLQRCWRLWRLQRRRRWRRWRCW